MASAHRFWFDRLFPSSNHAPTPADGSLIPHLPCATDLETREYSRSGTARTAKLSEIYRNRTLHDTFQSATPRNDFLNDLFVPGMITPASTAYGWGNPAATEYALRRILSTLAAH